MEVWKDGLDRGRLTVDRGQGTGDRGRRTGDAVTIFLVILNTIEVANEQRARKGISALQKMAESTALLSRAGGPEEIPAEQVVPGDVILLQAGGGFHIETLLSGVDFMKENGGKTRI